MILPIMKAISITITYLSTPSEDAHANFIQVLQ
jgi:hypothetical protein